jgi:hypothetical protein
MPDDVSADVDGRSIEDIIDNMMNLNKPSPSPEFIARNPRAATSMRMRAEGEERQRGEDIQQQFERAAMRDKYSEPYAPQPRKRAVTINPDGSFNIPKD